MIPPKCTYTIISILIYIEKSWKITKSVNSVHAKGFAKCLSILLTSGAFPTKCASVVCLPSPILLMYVNNATSSQLVCTP